jgi:hypothetical protein
LTSKETKTVTAIEKQRILLYQELKLMSKFTRALLFLKEIIKTKFKKSKKLTD